MRLEFSLVIECLPSMQEVLGSVKEKRREREGREAAAHTDTETHRHDHVTW